MRQTHKKYFRNSAVAILFAAATALNAGTPDVETVFSADIYNKSDLDSLKNIARQDNICAKLHEAIFPDIDKEIANLQSNSLGIRDTAMRNLVRAGYKARPRLERLLADQNTDPMTKNLIQQILAPHPESSQIKDTILALFVILQSPENPKENIDFLRFFFENFQSIPPPLQEFLPNALERSKSHRELIPAIFKAAKTQDNPGFQALFDPFLRNNAPREYAIIPKAIAACKSLRQINYHNFSCTAQSMKRLAITMMDTPYFDLIKDDVTRPLLMSNDMRKTGAGIYIAKDNPAPYANLIVNAAIFFPHDSDRSKDLEEILLELKHKKEVFHKYTDRLLGSGFRSFALATIDDPAKYKERLIDDISKDRSGATFKFVLQHFPNDRTYVKKVLIDKIKQTNSIAAAACDIKKLVKLKYQGGDLDKWIIKAIKEAKHPPGKYDLLRVMALNPSPDTVSKAILPRLRKIKIVNLCEWAKRAAKRQPELQREMMNILFEKYERNPAEENGFTRIWLEQHPEDAQKIFQLVLKDYLRHLAPDAPKIYHTTPEDLELSFDMEKTCESLANALKTSPAADTAWVEKAMRSDNIAERVMAAEILLKMNGNQRSLAFLQDIVASHKEPKLIECMLWKTVLTNPLPEDKERRLAILKGALDNPFDKYEKSPTAYSNILGAIKPTIPNIVDAAIFLQRALEEGKDDNEDAFDDILDALSRLDPNNPAVKARSRHRH